MPDTIPPTVPDTVAATDGILDNIDVSKLNAETMAAVETPPAGGEGEGKGEDAGGGEGDAQSEGENAADDAADGDSDAAEGEGEGEDGGEGKKGDEGSPEATKSAPAPTAPTEDPAAKQAEEQRRARATRIAEVNKKLAAIRAQPKEDRDPYELGDLLAEKDELRDAEVLELRQTAESAAEAAQTEKAWQKFERENPDIGAKGRRIWDEEMAKASKEFDNPVAAGAVANERWQNRLRLVRAKARDGKTAAASAVPSTPAKPAAKAPAAPAGRPAPTKGGASLIPKGAVARPIVKDLDPVTQLTASGAGFKGFLD